MGWGSGNLGGGGSGKLFAAIGVTYPAGSTLTCTDGKKTLKAKTTTGRWLFSVPYAGTWTVTATDGNSEVSKVVEIASEGQNVSVELAYSFYVYNRGDECVDVSGGWVSKAMALSTQYPKAQELAVTRGASSITAIQNGTSNQCGILYAAKKIDLTNVKSIEIRYSASALTGQSSFRGWTEIGTYVTDYNVLMHSPTAANTMETSVIDVSGRTGEMYLGFNVFNPAKQVVMEYLKCIY